MPLFPTYRGRRLRRTEPLRRLVRETTLIPSQLVLPLFVRNGKNLRRSIDAMPGVSQLSPDELVRDATAASEQGIGGVILFGIPDNKDETGSEAWAENGAVQNAVRLLKKEVPDLVVITDVCMCEYTSHGHCGILENGEVVNDATLELLSRASLSHAQAGADMIAPSDMMDGRVAAIRSALDQGGFINTPILSYAAKFASGYYGPFREAAESAPQSGDRKGYQMDAANADEALREVMADIDEGADAVMVKPAGPYLDIITRVKEATGYPVAAYQVSGEYSMICAAADNGWIDRHRVMMESLLGIRRAGADFILTYFAVEAASLLREK
jgi:porphobilinogen synthase